MPLHISYLCEGSITKLACKWSVTIMLSEMIPKITRLFVNLITPFKQALEEGNVSLSLWVLYFNHYVP